jgi:hypothetical protein
MRGHFYPFTKTPVVGVIPYLFQAVPADPIDDGIFIFDLSPGSEFLRERDLIYRRPAKIDDFKAMPAD